MKGEGVRSADTTSAIRKGIGTLGFNFSLANRREK